MTCDYWEIWMKLHSVFFRRTFKCTKSDRLSALSLLLPRSLCLSTSYPPARSDLGGTACSAQHRFRRTVGGVGLRAGMLKNWLEMYNSPSSEKEIPKRRLLKLKLQKELTSVSHEVACITPLQRTDKSIFHQVGFCSVVFDFTL